MAVTVPFTSMLKLRASERQLMVAVFSPSVYSTDKSVGLAQLEGVL